MNNLPSLRTHIDRENCKVMAIRDKHHCEITFDWTIINKMHSDGWHIYVINKEGIFFFINNVEEDGKDWCKIHKEEI